MFPDKRVEYKLYLAGLVFAAVSAAGIAVLVFTPFKIPDCTFKSVTGLYCPGCGGTYAPTLGKLTKLLSGDFTFFNESIFR